MNDFGKLDERKDSILKGFIDEDIEKARSGVYANTAQNKKLGRVGQKYGGKVGAGDADKKVMKHDMAVFQKVIDGHKKEDRDTYEKLTNIKEELEAGNMKQAFKFVDNLDTYQRELIPPRIYKKMGGELLESGQKKANVKTDLNLIAATGTKGDLYRAINKKYGTKFKVGDIEEFEDNAFRKELKVEDIESIVDDESSEDGGYKLSMDDEDKDFQEAASYRGKDFQAAKEANKDTQLLGTSRMKYAAAVELDKKRKEAYIKFSALRNSEGDSKKTKAAYEAFKKLDKQKTDKYLEIKKLLGMKDKHYETAIALHFKKIGMTGPPKSGYGSMRQNS